MHGGGVRVYRRFMASPLRNLDNAPRKNCARYFYFVMNSAERHEARYQRRRAARLEKRARDTKGLGDFESVFSFEHLYAAYRASVKGVGWKASTQRYKASALANIDKTHNALLSGTFKSKGFYEFDITERRVRSSGVPAIRASGKCGKS